MSADYDRAYAATLAHIDSNYGIVRDDLGNLAVGLVESELHPTPGDPSFVPITGAVVDLAIASVRPKVTQTS